MSTRSVAVVDEARSVGTLFRGPRLELLEALREQPDSASGLAQRLGRPRQTINYHLRQLERAGLVELVDERGHGRCVERVLATAATALALSPAALGPLAPRSRDLGEQASVEFLAARASEIVRDLGTLLARPEEVPTLAAETRIRFASADERAAFARDLRAALERLVSRYHDDRAPDGRTFTLLVAGHPEVTE